MRKRSTIILLVNLAYFEVGLMVSIIGALIPDIIKDYGLSYSAAAALPLAYYLSFGVLAIPSGIIIEKFSYKKVLVGCYSLCITGIIFFAAYQTYISSIISIFVIGCALTPVQVLAYPLIRETVGAKRLAFNTILNTFMYGIGAFASPYFYSMVISGVKNSSDRFPYNLLQILGGGTYPWAAVYWIFLFLFILTALLIIAIAFPPVGLKTEEKIGNLNSFRELLSRKYVYFYFISLFCYAACEQGVSNWLTQFLNNYHGIDPQNLGSQILSWYWLLMAAGCIAGMALLKYFDSARILLSFTIAVMVVFTLAVFGNRTTAIVCIPAIGFFHSVMWPVILSLALNSVSKHHGSLTGLLFAASTGGAFGPMIVGRLGDLYGLRIGLYALIFCYFVVASVYFWYRKTQLLKEPNAPLASTL
jgi:FHS family L-fucose permease-like MFS transporter